MARVFGMGVQKGVLEDGPTRKERVPGVRAGQCASHPPGFLKITEQPKEVRRSSLTKSQAGRQSHRVKFKVLKKMNKPTSKYNHVLGHGLNPYPPSSEGLAGRYFSPFRN